MAKEATTEAPAAAAAPVATRSVVMIKDPNTGQEVSRAVYIETLYLKGEMTRSEIVNHYNTDIAAKQGKAPIIYQTVRAITVKHGWNAADKARLEANSQKRAEKAARSEAARKAREARDKAAAEAAAAAAKAS